MDPLTIGLAQSGTQLASSAMTSGAILGASIINSTVSYINTGRNIKAQKERDARLEELQERHRIEDKYFQLERDDANRNFQLELEAQRMDFQEHLELRRLQFQVRMEKQKQEFQKALTERQHELNWQLAQFQTLAMRETQILVARENAQNMLANSMVLEALKTFPLNISPVVLLNNRPHSLSSLLRYTMGESAILSETEKHKLINYNLNDVIEDVRNYTEHPEALNIFIAPVFVDSRLPFQKSLSLKIWEATYQKIESFFTLHYSRDSKSPVVFYPTAWNDKYNSGVHASETLHYFLKDMPCIVLEPKFDGNTFRMAISTWGLGYSSTEHHRTECKFDANINLSIANAVYERSNNALQAINVILNSNISEKEKAKYQQIYPLLVKNVELYTAFGLGDKSTDSTKTKDASLKHIAALGINNIFSIDLAQDLEPIANLFSEHIGLTLALLADIHHLKTTSSTPRLPQLINSGKYFASICSHANVRKEISDNYFEVFVSIRDEEMSLAENEEKAEIIKDKRNNEIQDVREFLGFGNNTSFEDKVRKHVFKKYSYTNNNFEMVWAKFINGLTPNDKQFAESILRGIQDDNNKRDQLEERLETL